MTRGSGGFTLIELMIVVCIIALATAMAIPLYEDAVEKSHDAAVQADCYNLYNSLTTYQLDNDKFPSESEFDLETIAPLSDQGYFNAAATFTSKLFDDRVLIYLAPDVDGPDTQFIVIMRTKIDPQSIFAVVHTNIIADTDGWVDGIYHITAGDLEKASDDIGVGAKS